MYLPTWFFKKKQFSYLVFSIRNFIFRNDVKKRQKLKNYAKKIGWTGLQDKLNYIIFSLSLKASRRHP